MAELLAQKYLIKVCGVTTEDDAELVVAAGANAVGVILARSSRRVSHERARSVLHAVPASVVRVGVLRQTSDAELRRTLSELELDAVQVHGPLPASTHELARDHGVALIRAVGVNELGPLGTLEAAEAYLLDGPHPGSGREQEWTDIHAVDWPGALIVAGGLNGQNAAGVLASVGAWGCDAASGTESQPGRKDASRVASFVRAARDYFESREEQRG